MRALIYGEAPSLPTGFATVVRNVLLPLLDDGTIEDANFFGINYTGDPHSLTARGKPIKQWPARPGVSMDPDPYGRQRFSQMALSGAWPFDVLFVIQDHFIVAPFLPDLVKQLRAQVPQGRPPFRVVYYVPIDGEMLKPEWVGWIPEFVDYPVAYMHWSGQMLTSMVPALRDTLRVIYHGTNPETFFPLPAEERQAFRRNVMQVRDDQPLILWVNRNQPRKDGPRALQIFKRVLERHPNAIFFMHCNVVDSMGYNLDQVRQQLRIPQGSVRFPQGFSEGAGVPVSVLNQIYNAADVFMTTARGEGFGLSLLDAMCVGLPCIAPKHTSFAEILADDRGVLVPPLPDYDIIIMDNDQLRPKSDADAMAAKVCWAIEQPEHARGLGRRGQAWAQSQSWKDAIVPQWAALFREAEASLQGPAMVAAPYALRPEALGL